MTKTVDEFRTKLSQEPRLAVVDRDKEKARTIRSLMTALDNTGAVSKDEISRNLDPSKTEISRRMRSKEIHAMLESEIQL